MVEINDYEIEKECIYKDEHYLVRDNGAILRLPMDKHKARPLDHQWTFGTFNKETGYMLFCGERVHRIVAYAFLGYPPAEEYVVDHIDTNRCNNRPENLRWLTKLENVLNNPITCAKIKQICGSIEAFLDNPSILNGYERRDENFKWMRNVTKEEAQNCLQRLNQWAKNPQQPSGKGIDEWIFNPMEDPTLQKLNNAITYRDYEPQLEKKNYPEIIYKEPEPQQKESLTPNAVQLNWKIPVRFCFCPQSPKSQPLKEYFNNLKIGEVFCEYNSYDNHLSQSIISDFAMPTPDVLWVICKINIAWKTHAITKITYKNGIFYHLNWGTLDAGDDIDEIIKDIKEGRGNDL